MNKICQVKIWSVCKVTSLLVIVLLLCNPFRSLNLLQDETKGNILEESVNYRVEKIKTEIEKKLNLAQFGLPVWLIRFLVNFLINLIISFSLVIKR